MCLPFNSCHPRHCPRSIPHSQCLRIKRICSDEGTFMKRAKELKDKLQKRGYPEKLLQGAINKVAAIPREETLTYKEKKTNDRVPVIITHHPQNPPLRDWLKGYMPILHSSSRMKKAVPEPPIIGERKCRNLRSLLMPSKLPKRAPEQQQLQQLPQRPPKSQRQKQRLIQPQQPTRQPQQLEDRREAEQQENKQKLEQQTDRQIEQQVDGQHVDVKQQTDRQKMRVEQQVDRQHTDVEQAMEDQHKGQMTENQNGCYKCTKSRCVLCQNHLRETRTFKSATNGTQYTIRDHITCKSSNIIYVIDCQRCERVQYVGETGQTLQKRFYGHTYNIRHYDPNTYQDPDKQTDRYKEDTMVAKHFNDRGHNITDMRCTAIEQVHAPSAAIRKRREKFWRHQLQTNYPDGLNVFD